MRILPVSTRTCAIALIAAAAIALTACGGGGLSSDDEAALQDDLDAAVAQAEAALAQAAADAAARAAAEAAQAAAQAAQAAAEAAQAAAEAAQAEAEAAQRAAEAQAEADRLARETTEAEAEADRLARVVAEVRAESALTAQQRAEAEAEAARAAQQTAEAEAEAARTAQAAAEAAQRQAELDKAAAETSSAEAIRAAEQARMDKEAADRAAMEAEAARVAAVAEQMRAEAERDEAVTKQEEAEDVRDAAIDKQQQAESARREAETAQREAEAERDEAEAERDEAERLLRLARLDALTTEQQRQAAEAEQERLRREAERQREQLEREVTEAEQTELRARARSFAVRLNAPAPGSAFISWKRGSRSLTFRPEGSVTTPGSAAPSVPGGWRSFGFTGQTGTAATLTNETVYLYTNIQAPSSRNFWKVHNVEVAAQTAGALNGDLDNVPTPTASQAQYDTDPNNSALASGVRVRGTYDGVSGTFTCTVPACMGDKTTVNLAGFVGPPDANGVRSFITGEWSFKPDSITSRVKPEDQADQDDAFLYFGVWSSIPDEIDISDANAALYNFRYIADGGAEPASNLTNFAQLMGPATFRGGAVGMYTTQGQVGGQNAKIGTFTATATLNADFGDGTAQGTLSGSITDFREGGSPLAGWRVTLGGDTDVGEASTITAGAASGDTVANIGGLSVDGEWEATFYGSDNQILADRNMYPAAQYPIVDLAGVAGQFNAAGGDPNDVALAGAFGATPQ